MCGFTLARSPMSAMSVARLSPTTLSSSDTLEPTVAWNPWSAKSAKAFYYSFSFIRHMRKKSYVCRECGKAFTQPANFLQHSRIHTGEKPFECTVCEKAFYDTFALVRHMRTHTGHSPLSAVTVRKHLATTHPSFSTERSIPGLKRYMAVFFRCVHLSPLEQAHTSKILLSVTIRENLVAEEIT